MTVAYN